MTAKFENQIKTASKDELEAMLSTLRHQVTVIVDRLKYLENPELAAILEAGFSVESIVKGSTDKLFKHVGLAANSSDEAIDALLLQLQNFGCSDLTEHFDYSNRRRPVLIGFRGKLPGVVDKRRKENKQ